MAGGGEYSLWSDLPAELAGLVLRQLPASYADRARFSSVCRHWRYAAKLLLQSPSTIPPALPWLKILDGDRRTFQSLPDGELHRLPVIGPPPLLSANMGWLLFQDASGQHYLKNPLSGAVLRLPVHCKAPANSSSSSSCGSDEFQIRKLIACTQDNTVAALISYRGLPPTVACCRPGPGNTPPWSMGRLVTGSGDTRYEDMAIFKSKAYTVTPRGDLFAHDITRLGTAGEVYVEPRVDHIIVGHTSDSDLDGAYAYMACGRRSYLVASARGDKLRMVRWIVPYDQHLIPGQYCRRGCTACAAAKTMAFKVFEAADMESGGRWMELERLDHDEVLFVSAHYSKAMSIGSMSSKSSYGGVRGGGQIYFAGGNLSSWCSGGGPITGGPTRTGGPVSRCPTRTCGVYDMRTKLISPISSKWPISDQSPASWFFPFVDHNGEEDSNSDKNKITWRGMLSRFFTSIMQI